MTVTTGLSGLDERQRAALERLVARARSLLEEDFAAQAEGRFGIHGDGRVEDEAALPDDSVVKAIRRDLVEIIAHLRTLGETPAGAVGRLLREAAFTHLNRLFAIRIAEALDLLPESLAKGRQSRGFTEFGEVMPILSDDYWGYLQLCGDELAPDVPSLFDPRNPLLPLAPRKAALDELVELLADPVVADVWIAPDTLGWTYQFFNTGDERRQMREESGAPRTSRELAVRNQFFTPRYVVDFLVHNTLGRRLIEDDPTSSLLEDLPLVVDPPTTKGPSLDLEDVAVLDPACGSGHFLLGCYDVLERAWEVRGVPPAESAPAIVSSLWGIDIDPRCTQVASAAIVFRARRPCRDVALPRPRIVTARNLPGATDALPEELSEQHQRLIGRISEVLADAPLLGPLLKAEDMVEREVRHAAFDGDEGTLPLSEDAFAQVEAELMVHLQAVADRASSSVAERLLAAEADDALRFVEAVTRRYNVVLMNPPFGEPVPETKAYLRATYPWLPTKDSNLLAAFVGRGVNLCKPDGYVGAITSRAGMFLSTFERWRRDVVLHNRLQALTDLGLGVMAQALVEAAAYTIGPGRPEPDREATFVSLLRHPDREAGLREAIAADRTGVPDDRIHRVRLADLDAIPGAPLAYWMSASLRRLFSDLPAVEGDGADVRQGLATGDDFRFVRAFWEVDACRIARSSEETNEGKRWCPFVKGGSYSPFWADVHLVVDWERDGERLRAYEGSRVQNTQYFFRCGLTWPLRTASGFSPRVLPAGCVFGHKGPAAVAHEPLGLLAWLTSRPTASLMAASQPAGDETSSGTASKSYEVGLVQKLPWPGLAMDQDVLDALTQLATDMAARRREQDTLDETARGFLAPPLPTQNRSMRETASERCEAANEAALASIVDSGEIEACFASALAFDGEAVAYLDQEIGPHPSAYPSTPIDDVQEFGRLFELPMDQLIDAVIEQRGGARAIATMTFVADRRIEVLSHAFARHPSVIEGTRKRLGLLPPGEPLQTAESLLSYLFGLAIGRWDVRVAVDRTFAPALPALFDPLPLCAPGMLVGSDGLPSASAPPEYPLELPPTRLLVDEQGHGWDAEAAVFEAAELVLEDPAGALEDALTIVGRKTVRDYLRRHLFKEHLSRYSKSRRKAPIYWPLTVPSRNWGVWVYAPMLTRETLFAVGREAARRERLAAEASARLEREQGEGGAGRSARHVAAELDAEQKLQEELRQFRAEAERIAGLGWDPDLGDGIVLCAAPLADLFPAWSDAKKARDELRNGRYEWATVAKRADQL